MRKPIKNTLSLDQDAQYARQLMGWLQELEQEKAAQSAADKIFRPEAVQGRML